MFAARVKPRFTRGDITVAAGLDALDQCLRLWVAAVVDHDDGVQAGGRISLERLEAAPKPMVGPVRHDDDVHCGTVAWLAFRY